MSTNSDSKSKPPAGEVVKWKEKSWELRMWYGMHFLDWIRVLWRGGFRVHFLRWGLCLGVTFFSVVNLFTTILQWLIYGSKIRRMEIEQPPVFIVGHWRSGTTLLHEYMVLDSRNSYPDTFVSMCPRHFLIARWIYRWWLWVLLPKRRPMDNVKMGFDRPQEDEFALLLMGAKSPYRVWSFPNQGATDPEFLDMRNTDAKDLAEWKSRFVKFLKAVQIQRPGRIVLKSPTHLGRLSVLMEMFPDAKVIHIVRNPFDVYPSTVNTWRRLWKFQALQIPNYDGLDEYVLGNFTRMYDAFEEDRKLVPPENFCEIRYEDLVADPTGEMRRIYEQLNLGDFDSVLPALENSLEGTKDYKRNRFEMEPELRAKITRRWAPFIEKYGYGE